MKQVTKVKFAGTALLLSLFFSLIFPAQSLADSQLQVQLSQDKLAYDESVVVTFDYPENSNDKLSEFFINASELGYKREIRVDPLLKEQTLTVSS
ncbi:MAG: hypothetical protein PHR37_01605, partial [Eubacteriales bacterium]|nr:hypothetical protein [Eubacteriales bacterium]